MRILRRKKHDFTISRAGIKHRSLLEQPDVHFYGALKFKLNGKYKDCLALLRSTHISIRDRKHLENIIATVRLDKGVRFHIQQDDSNGDVSNGNNSPSDMPSTSQMVKFELHVGSSGHGRAVEFDESFYTKHEFKCKSVDVRNLWKTYILALVDGIHPKDSDVILLPGQIVQIEKMIETEKKRRSERSLTSTPRVSSSSSDDPSSHSRRHGGKVSAHKSKSLHPHPAANATKEAGHKFYKDGSKGIPSYFFENVSREMAEAVLTMGDMYGNVLMRRSTSYPNSYALSFRSTINRSIEIFHYEISPIRKHSTLELYYEIKMEGRHPKFRCLNDVVKYFVKLTDGLAHCFTTNDLDKLGVKQPPYATHYEPPTEYFEDDEKNLPASPRSPVTAHPPLPPIPRQHVQHQDDPNSEEITPLPASDTDEDILQFVEPINRVLRGVSPECESPRMKPALKEPYKSSMRETDSPRKPSLKQPEMHGKSSAGLKKEQTPQDGDLDKAAVKPFPDRSALNPKPSSGHSVTFVPPPPPPPAPHMAHRPRSPDASQRHAVMPKSGLKVQPDRKQFAPEKNLFRIALECEEKAGSKDAAVIDGGVDGDVITEAKDLACQLKGNVKSRVANLETEPDKKAVPNFSRPPKKDFMGELAEKLKIRRQVVEQTCW
ncbi:uncharacterized protein LOC129602296 isoform X2 [Paramacrobiotus metropolitanus]|uniref:uncharacterized protein LOC129602296 isoform X2 n=1 Tax=Paramacrobiotus metropolitanus TaxID=2943436 RepID=UPI00244652B4|nr:uncharacterized protein LOC129602296 isoform X2 [Paramacrobiotus metropolitanus]